MPGSIPGRIVDNVVSKYLSVENNYYLIYITIITMIFI